MPATKTETLTCRIAPEVKAGLREAAAREHRSAANVPEVMIQDHARSNAGIAARSAVDTWNRPR